MLQLIAIFKCLLLRSTSRGRVRLLLSAELSGLEIRPLRRRIPPSMPPRSHVDGILRAAVKYSAEALAALRAEIADWNERVKVERTEDTASNVKPVAKHGGERTKADEQGDNITLPDRGTSAAYLAARIKRDAPEG